MTNLDKKDQIYLSWENKEIYDIKNIKCVFLTFFHKME